jgi:geranylgeranyl pyrophosphate synthase
MLASNEKADIDLLIDPMADMGSCDEWANTLPLDGRLKNLLGLESHGEVEDILFDALLEPISKLTANPGKRVRGKLVHLAYRMINSETQPSMVNARRLRVGAEVLELIHAGSLIVDDIEDGSPMRRGMPALHVRYGLPIALNAGSWLYFWPFELVKDLGLSRDLTLSAYEYYHHTLLRAHFGQAMDIGTRVDRLPQERVAKVCLASLKLKTGALMGFAMVMGGLIAGAEEKLNLLLDDFGRELGVALQMFDDIGNITGVREPAKRFEDFTLYRPSWAWAWAAMNSSPMDYADFVKAVAQLPDAKLLETWIASHQLVSAGRASAQHHMERAFSKLKSGLEEHRVAWSRRAFDELKTLGEEIARAYK